MIFIFNIIIILVYLIFDIINFCIGFIYISMLSLLFFINYMLLEKKLISKLLKAYFEKQKGANEKIPDNIKNFIS